MVCLRGRLPSYPDSSDLLTGGGVPGFGEGTAGVSFSVYRCGVPLGAVPVGFTLAVPRERAGSRSDSCCSGEGGGTRISVAVPLSSRIRGRTACGREPAGTTDGSG